MTPVWPRDLLSPRHCSVNKAFRSVSGGVALDGSEGSVSSDAGVWSATYKEFPIPDTRAVLMWRSLATKFYGKTKSVLIPIYEHRRAPFPSGFIPPSPEHPNGRTPHSDQTPFSDQSMYRTSVIDVTLSAGSPLRAVQLSIQKHACGELYQGHRFSIGERLYEIDDIESQTATDAIIKVWPPLRQAVFANDFCEFVNPVLKVKLIQDDGMREDLDFNRWGFPTVEFIEDTL